MTRKQRELLDRAQLALEAVEGLKKHLELELESKRVQAVGKLDQLAKELRTMLDEASERGTLPIASIRFARCQQLLSSATTSAAEYIEVYTQARLLGMLKRQEGAA